MNLFFSVTRSLPTSAGTAPFRKQPHADRGKGKDSIVGSWCGHSPLQAGELLFQKRVVGCACFLTFKPLQVPRNPRVMAFTRRAREDIRPKGPKEVIELSLGALPVHARRPLPDLLMAVLPVGHLPKPLASFGIGDDP